MAMRKSTKKARKLPPNALKYCPNYIALDREARKESKMRFRQHVTERRKLLVQCIDPALHDLRNPVLRLQFSSHPIYHDDDNIINTAFTAIDNKINEWNGVQFSKKFITEFNKTGTHMDRKQFDKGATNHQDQTSWKVSGNKVFAPYISAANSYYYKYCQCITNIGEKERHEIYKLTCIAYAVTLLSKEIKFHRTKGKPLIRHKTLVKSDGIHIELERLYLELKVKNFVAAAKKKAKEEGKNTIASKEFHKKLLDCCNTLYRDQKKKVYDSLGVALKYEEIEESSVYPHDLMDPEPDNNDNNDGYKPYQSPSYSTNSTQSTQITESRRSRTTTSPREFQRVNPREFSVRNDINRNRNREKRRYRESVINDRSRHKHDVMDDDDDEHTLDHERTDVSIQSDVLLTDESVYNQQKSSCDNNNECRSRRCRECGQQCHCHQPSYLNDLSDSNALRIQELQRQNNQLKSTLIGLELELLNVQQQLYAYPYDGYVQSQQQSAVLPPLPPLPPPNHSYVGVLPSPLLYQPPMMMRRRRSNPLYGDTMSMDLNNVLFPQRSVSGNVNMMNDDQDILIPDASSLPNLTLT